MIHEYDESPVFDKDITFGEFLRKKRRLMGLNQTDFGAKLGYGQHTISFWENGNYSPPIDTARYIVEELGGEIHIVNYEE